MLSARTRGITNSALLLLGARYLPAIETALIPALDAPLAPLWVWLFFAESPALPQSWGISPKTPANPPRPTRDIPGTQPYKAANHTAHRFFTP